MKALQIARDFLKGDLKNTVSDNLRRYSGLPVKTKIRQKALKSFSAKQIREYYTDLRSGKIFSDPEDLPIEIFALVAETFHRKMDITLYDEQLIAAKAMSEMNIIEMQTGEGKTMVAVLVACLLAARGQRVHVLTFNDYLAERDSQWMQGIYEYLGLQTSFVSQNSGDSDRRIAYNADVLYATAKSVGFDYLKSTMAYSKEENILPGFDAAIVDEADAILIDEARNPLVFAGENQRNIPDLYHISEFCNTLVASENYDTDEYSRNVYLTETGIALAEAFFDVEKIYDDSNSELLTAINLALQAKVLLKRDIDYIVEDGRIRLVDELTGRIIEDRKWQNGLQSAVEAKEGVPILTDGVILNSITIQHLIGMYQNYCGMTGTAVAASDEFAALYGLGVFMIPTHLPSRRRDRPDLIFSHREAKMQAIVREIRTVHQTGQPILIGTLTVAESEELADLCRSEGLRPVVLNAKNDREEAEIIKDAGMPGAITISTNMAGRGTDIRLGGHDEQYKRQVAELGGLYVLGTNRHESSRIDNQLRGRSGRQGDPGTTRFIISMEDPLMIRYRLRELLPKKYQFVRSKEPIFARVITREVDRAQRIIEGQLFEIRKTLCEYTGFVESLRVVHYDRRRVIMESADQEIGRFLLHHYDLKWSEMLGEVQQIREGIAWERIAGRNPVREFIKKCDLLFRNMEDDLTEMMNALKENPGIVQPVKKPASTWTYVINDNPAGDPLTSMLRDASNIGMQIDPTAGIMLLLNRWFVKRNRSKN